MSFRLYRSSAGSGKTYTLVKEYLSLVLKDPEKFKHILAVTFTNKAAAEMKERILQALKKLAKKEDRVLAKYLSKENPDLRNIHRLSSDLLTQLLHNYSDFAIMTIDSFIHKVLRSFALEIGLPLTFTIDLNYERIYTYVVERLIGSVGRNEHNTRVILDFVFARIREEKSWNIEPDIRGFVGDLFNEKNTDWAAEVGGFKPEAFERYREQLNEYQDNFIRRMKELGDQGLRLIEEEKLSLGDFYKNGAAHFLVKCRDLNRSGLTKFELGKNFLNERWYTQKSSQAFKDQVEALLSSGLSRIHAEIIELYDHHFKIALTAHFMLENIYLAAIVSEIKQLIEEYKTRNNVVPISEFNVKVYEIVKHSPVPFIYAILGEKFNHYLIDEFQDTSRMQWENLFPLIDNALAYNYFNLAVGDGKQSIYRWRGGDVEIMQQEIEQGLMGEHLDIELLEDNYRSKENIVNFNNNFFEGIRNFYLEKNILLKDIYKDLDQYPLEKHKGGFVSLRFISETSRKDEADPQVFGIVNDIVTDCLDNLGFKMGDIAILVRAKSEGRKIADNLLRQGRKVVSPDSLTLARVPLVRFLIDVLTYLNNPEDHMTRSSIIYYLCLNQHGTPMTPEVIGHMFMSKEAESALLPDDIKEFFKRRKFLIRMPVYEVMEEVIRIFHLEKSLDFETAGYLQAFLNIVSNYSTENNVDFSSFLDWWESNEEDFSLEVPENVDAIKIMTIHKAKGLEFPVVIVPYSDWKHAMDRQLWLTPDYETFKLEPKLDIPMPIKTRGRLDETLFADELTEEKKKVVLDNINLLYVAFTRAVDHLHIICRKQKEKKNNGPDDDLSNYELLRDIAVPIMDSQRELGGNYTLGKRVEKKKTPAQTIETEDQRVSEFISTQWYKKITIRRKATEFWRFDEGYSSDRRSWGILVHYVLSTIQTIEDVPTTVTNIMNSGDIEADERDELIEKINDIFEIAQVRKWFEPGLQVFTEAPVITDAGVLRPDRVVIDEDRVIIIDFKTGMKSDSHSKQLITYMDAMTAMGHQNVDAFLLYLEQEEIEKVER